MEKQKRATTSFNIFVVRVINIYNIYNIYNISTLSTIRQNHYDKIIMKLKL